MFISYRIEGQKLVASADGQGEVHLWVAPTADERRRLVEEQGIDEHTLVSALDHDELPRLDFEDNHIAVILKRPRTHVARDNYLFRVSSYGMFLFDDRLVVVVPEDVPVFEGRLFTRVNTTRDVALRAVYRTIFHFTEHVKVINMISESIEVKINSSMENRYLIDLFTLEKSLVYYLNAISNNGMVAERLRLNAHRLKFNEDAQEILEEIVIENNQCFKQAEIYSKVLTGMSNARASIVSNNLNSIMKTLSTLTVALMVPTLVVSSFSMNVQIPMSEIPWAFWIILGMATFSVVAFVVMLRFKLRLKRW